MAADGKPYGLTCNSFASVSLNPPLVLWSLGMFSQRPEHFPERQPFHGQYPRRIAAGPRQQIRQIVRRQSSPGSTGRRGSATRRFSPTALPISSAARPTAIMAATTSFSSARSRPMPITGRSRCCSRAAVTGGSFHPAAAHRHEQESPSQAVRAPSSGGCRRTTAARSSSPRRPNSFPRKDLPAARAISPAGSV